MKEIKVLFVCLGNICRSPMAEFVFRQQVRAAGAAERIVSASAGTSGWHDGEDMHRETAAVLRRQGIAPEGFVSSRVKKSAAAEYDFIVAMDDDNLAALERLFGRRPEQIFKLTDLIPESGYGGVPDPWYTGDFEETYRLCQAGCAALLRKISG